MGPLHTSACTGATSTNVKTLLSAPPYYAVGKRINPCSYLRNPLSLSRGVPSSINTPCSASGIRGVRHTICPLHQTTSGRNTSTKCTHKFCKCCDALAPQQISILSRISTGMMYMRKNNSCPKRYFDCFGIHTWAACTRDGQLKNRPAVADEVSTYSTNVCGPYSNHLSETLSRHGDAYSSLSFELPVHIPGGNLTCTLRH